MEATEKEKKNTAGRNARSAAKLLPSRAFAPAARGMLFHNGVAQGEAVVLETDLSKAKPLLLQETSPQAFNPHPFFAFGSV